MDPNLVPNGSGGTICGVFGGRPSRRGQYSSYQFPREVRRDGFGVPRSFFNESGDIVVTDE